HELTRRHRLGEIGVGAVLERLAAIGDVGEDAREHQHGNRRGLFGRLESAAHLAAREVVKLDVEHDEIRPRVGQSQALGADPGGGHREARGAERAREESSYPRVVVDDQHARDVAIGHNPITIRGLLQFAPLPPRAPIYIWRSYIYGGHRWEDGGRRWEVHDEPSARLWAGGPRRVPRRRAQARRSAAPDLRH